MWLVRFAEMNSNVKVLGEGTGEPKLKNWPSKHFFNCSALSYSSIVLLATLCTWFLFYSVFMNCRCLIFLFFILNYT